MNTLLETSVDRLFAYAYRLVEKSQGPWNTRDNLPSNRKGEWGCLNKIRGRAELPELEKATICDWDSIGGTIPVDAPPH